MLITVVEHVYTPGLFRAVKFFLCAGNNAVFKKSSDGRLFYSTEWKRG